MGHTTIMKEQIIITFQTNSVKTIHDTIEDHLKLGWLVYRLALDVYKGTGIVIMERKLKKNKPLT